jgi:hypothetical protein
LLTCEVGEQVKLHAVEQADVQVSGQSGHPPPCPPGDSIVVPLSLQHDEQSARAADRTGWT